MATNTLGGATFSNPYALPGTPTVNAKNTTTPVTSNTGSTLPQVLGGFSGSGASGSFDSTYDPVSTPAPTQNFDSKSTNTASPATPIDPYAGTVFGSTANYNLIHGDWLAQKDAALGSIQDRVNNDYNGYNSSVQDFGDNVKTGQSHINDSYVQNELAKIEGERGVNDMVGTGVRSAGVVIGNRPGAATSSAGEAIARAYSLLGQRAMGQVGNQYQKGLHDIGMQQNDFNTQVSEDARHLSENKTKIVNDIATDTASQIAALNAAAATASLPDRLDIEAQKEQVRNQALTMLSQLDAVVSDYQSKAAPSSKVDQQAQATTMANAGLASTSPFDLTPTAPAQFQGTGPFEGDLPLFTAPGKKTNI